MKPTLFTLVMVLAAMLALSEAGSKIGIACTGAGDCDSGNHEECSDTTQKCACKTGETCEDPCKADSCHGHGTCASDGKATPAPVCKCSDGYKGDHCETVDPCKTDSCNGHGNCTSDGKATPAPVCKCSDGYKGDHCETAPQPETSVTPTTAPGKGTRSTEAIGLITTILISALGMVFM